MIRPITISHTTSVLWMSNVCIDPKCRHPEGQAFTAVQNRELRNSVFYVIQSNANQHLNKLCSSSSSEQHQQLEIKNQRLSLLNIALRGVKLLRYKEKKSVATKIKKGRQSFRFFRSLSGFLIFWSRPLMSFFFFRSKPTSINV